MTKQVYNSFHEPLLPIGIILGYKTFAVKIVEYDGYHDGFADYYVIKPMGESPFYERIVRYDDEHLEVIK